MDRRDAQAPVPQRLQHLRVPLHELHRDLPIEGGALRHPELAHEEVIEARVAWLLPPALPVEVRQGGDEVCDGDPLVREELGQPGDEGSGSVGHHGEDDRMPL